MVHFQGQVALEAGKLKTDAADVFKNRKAFVPASGGRLLILEEVQTKTQLCLRPKAGLCLPESL